jgi:hypothetical protein
LAASQYSPQSAAHCQWIVGRDTDLPVVIVLIAAPFGEMGSVNFAVSFYTGWPHSLDSEARQFRDIRRNPPRLNLMCGSLFALHEA